MKEHFQRTFFFALHLLLGLVFCQSAGEALAALNWTALQMGEIFIRFHGPKLSLGDVSRSVGGAAVVVPAVPFPFAQHIARLTLNTHTFGA